MENQRVARNQGTTGEQPAGVRESGVYNYRNLDLWRRAQELAVDIIRLGETLPSSPASVVLARQVVRSAASVGANIAEGHGRYSLAAYRNHLSIAKGALDARLGGPARLGAREERSVYETFPSEEIEEAR